MQKKKLEIEGLRAIAIILVLVEHWPAVAPWSDHAWNEMLAQYLDFGTGVDLFLVISGYVVTRSLLLASTGAARLDWTILKGFFVKRAFRLFPSAYVWVAVTLLLTVFANWRGQFGALDSNLKQAFSILTYSYNFYVPHLVRDQTEVITFGFYWSLSLEEQFYVLLPLICLAMGWRHLALTLVVLIALQWILRTVWPGWLWPYIRVDGMMIGAMFAWLELRRPSLWRALDPQWLRPGALAFALTCALIAAMAAGAMMLPDIFSHLVPTVSAATVVFLAARDRGIGLGHGAFAAALSWIGARSYAIYLIHLPMIRLNREVWLALLEPRRIPIEPYWPLMALTALGLTLVFSELNHRIIERPLTERGRRIAAGIHARGGIVSNRPVTAAAGPT